MYQPVRRSGVTLLELIVVMIIIAVLAGIAIPNYQKTVARAQFKAAKDVLLTIFSGEQVYRTLNDAYRAIGTPLSPLPPNANPTAWNPIFMDDPNPNFPTGPLGHCIFGVTADNANPNNLTFAAAVSCERLGGLLFIPMAIDQTGQIACAGFSPPYTYLSELCP